MFYCSRGNLIEGLEALQRTMCQYDMADKGSEPPHSCDCKFGVRLTGTPQVFAHHGEQSGCPELRVALEIVRQISDSQYRNLLEADGRHPDAMPAVKVDTCGAIYVCMANHANDEPCDWTRFDKGFLENLSHDEILDIMDQLARHRVVSGQLNKFLSEAKARVQKDG